MDCEQAKSIVSGFSLIRECDVIKNGALRMSVPFQNSDGSSLDLFLKKNSDSTWVLSDLGNTIAYLLDLHVKPWKTKKRARAIEDICSSLKIDHHQGQFQTILGDDELRSGLPEAMVRLSQACIRVSDLAFTQRLRTPASFQDDLEDFFDSSDLVFNPKTSLRGRFGKEIKVDFQVRGKNVSSLVQTLSTANAAAAHNISNEVFAKWFDLSDYRETHQFLTIYDTNTDHFRDDDLKRISAVSTIFGFPAEADQIKDSLAA